MEQRLPIVFTYSIQFYFCYEEKQKLFHFFCLSLGRRKTFPNLNTEIHLFVDRLSIYHFQSMVMYPLPLEKFAHVCFAQSFFFAEWLAQAICAVLSWLPSLAHDIRFTHVTRKSENHIILRYDTHREREDGIIYLYFYKYNRTVSFETTESSYFSCWMWVPLTRSVCVCVHMWVYCRTTYAYIATWQLFLSFLFVEYLLLAFYSFFFEILEL